MTATIRLKRTTGSVVGRPHAGFYDGGRRAAIVLSLIATCCLHEASPSGRTCEASPTSSPGAWPDSRLRELLPNVWSENKRQETEPETFPEV